ncbi:MAG: NAD(P)H-dependent oxidoreductase [Prevotellaceae bacterium]|jgi:NAD(P)H dehydrogenase (quinone)|nr:NAD(P)H-dependent oxidoreductase [Prevotellaceae bacterium]
MKHLIIYTHINPESFSQAILDTVLDASATKGAELNVRNLNALNFNPILSANDMEALNQNKTPADIKTEQDFVIWADIITFIYPLWWGHMPAIMKGYIDRVYAYNFAYTYTDEGNKGLLPDKKIMLFTPMGNPYDVYEKTGMLQALKITTDTCIFRFCGMTDIEHLHFGSVGLVDDTARKQMLDDVKELVIQML